MTAPTLRANAAPGEIFGKEDYRMGNYDKSQIESIRLEAMATLHDEKRVERGLEDIVSQCERLERRIATRQATPSSLPEVA